MKVDNGVAQQAYASAAYRSAQDPARVAPGAPKGVQDAEAGIAKTRSSDSIAISAQGRLRAQALDAVRSTPEARAKLVLDLRSQIKTGTFTMDDNKLAGQIANHIDMRA